MTLAAGGPAGDGRLAPSDLVPDELDRPFWDACNRHEFLLHRCARCGTHYWPASCCTRHGGDDMEWVPASGRGTIRTFVVYHQAFHPRVADEVPYNVCVVELDEGPFFHSRVVGCAPNELRIGQRVQVVLESSVRG